jgi:hypothetical protein
MKTSQLEYASASPATPMRNGITELIIPGPMLPAPPNTPIANPCLSSGNQ